MQSCLKLVRAACAFALVSGCTEGDEPSPAQAHRPVAEVAATGLQAQFRQTARCAELALFLSPSGRILAASWPKETTDEFTRARQWALQRRFTVDAIRPIGSGANTDIDAGHAPRWTLADDAYFRGAGYLRTLAFGGDGLRSERIPYTQRDQDAWVEYPIDQLPTVIEGHVYSLSGVMNRNIVAIPIRGGDANVLHHGDVRNKQWVLSSRGEVIAATQAADAPSGELPRDGGPTEVSLIPRRAGARIRLGPGERFRFFPPIPFDPQRDTQIFALSNRDRPLPALVSLDLRSGREDVLATPRSEQMAAAVSRDGRHWYWVVSQDPLPIYSFSAESPAPLRSLAERDRYRMLSLVDQSLDGRIWLLRTYSPSSGLGYSTFDATTGELAALPTVCDGVAPPVDLSIGELRLSGGQTIRTFSYRSRSGQPSKPLVVYLPSGPFEPLSHTPLMRFERLSYAPSPFVTALLAQGFPVVALQYPRRDRHDPRPAELNELLEMSHELLARVAAADASGDSAIIVGEGFGGWLGLRLLERGVGSRLIGVSSAMSLYDMRRAPQFSADWQEDLPWAAEELALELNRWPPGVSAVFVHGGRDHLIRPGAARIGVDTLTRRGLNARLILRPRMLHSRLAPNDWAAVLNEIAQEGTMNTQR